MPRRWLMQLKHPKWGCGTCIEAYWCFTDQVPLLAEIVRRNGGEIKFEGATLRFGRPAKFLHKLIYASK